MRHGAQCSVHLLHRAIQAMHTIQDGHTVVTVTKLVVHFACYLSSEHRSV